MFRSLNLGLQAAMETESLRNESGYQPPLGGHKGQGKVKPGAAAGSPGNTKLN